MDLQVLRAEVALRRQQHLNVLGRGVENRREIGRSHDGPIDILSRRVWMEIQNINRLAIVPTGDGRGKRMEM